MWNTQNHFMAKCLLPCSSSNSCLQSNPRKILFLFSTLDILITQTCRKALWFTSRQFILGTDNSLMLWHCLQLSSEGYNLEWLHQAHAGKHKPLVVEERQEGLPESIILLQPGAQEYTQFSPFLKKIWEPPNQPLPATCTSVLHGHCLRHSAAALSHTLTLLWSRYPHHSYTAPKTRFYPLIIVQNMYRSGQHHKHSVSDLLM